MGPFQLEIFYDSVIIQIENTEELHSGICFDFYLFCVTACFPVFVYFNRGIKIHSQIVLSNRYGPFLLLRRGGFSGALRKA